MSEDLQKPDGSSNDSEVGKIVEAPPVEGPPADVETADELDATTAEIKAGAADAIDNGPSLQGTEGLPPEVVAKIKQDLSLVDEEIDALSNKAKEGLAAAGTETAADAPAPALEPLPAADTISEKPALVPGSQKWEELTQFGLRLRTSVDDIREPISGLRGMASSLSKNLNDPLYRFVSEDNGCVAKLSTLNARFTQQLDSLRESMRTIEEASLLPNNSETSDYIRNQTTGLEQTVNELNQTRNQLIKYCEEGMNFLRGSIRRAEEAGFSDKVEAGRTALSRLGRLHDSVRALPLFEDPTAKPIYRTPPAAIVEEKTGSLVPVDPNADNPATMGQPPDAPKAPSLVAEPEQDDADRGVQDPRVDSPPAPHDDTEADSNNLGPEPDPAPSPPPTHKPVVPLQGGRAEAVKTFQAGYQSHKEFLEKQGVTPEQMRQATQNTIDDLRRDGNELQAQAWEEFGQQDGTLLERPVDKDIVADPIDPLGGIDPATETATGVEKDVDLDRDKAAEPSIENNIPLNSEDLASLEASNELLELLSFPDSIRQDHPDIYQQTLLQTFNNNFRERQGQDQTATEKQFEAFKANIERLTTIKETIASVLMPEGARPTKAQEKVLTAISLFLSESLASDHESTGGTFEEQISEFKNVDTEIIIKLLSELKIKFTDPMENDELVTKNENGDLLVAPTDTNTRNIDLLNLQRQILSKIMQTESLPHGSEDEDGQEEENNSILEWFKEQGISKEDLVIFQRFRQQDAFALTCVYRDNSANPQNSNRIQSLVAEFNVMANESKKDPDKIYKISATIENLYHQELENYRQKWTIIQQSGLNINDIPGLEGLDDLDEMFNSGGSDELTPVDKTKSGEGSSEKDGTDKSLKERANSALKSDMPKNLKEAFYRMLGAFEKDILDPLNLPGAVVDDIAKWQGV